MANTPQHDTRTSEPTCLKCGRSQPGSDACFAYTREAENLRQQIKSQTPRAKPNQVETETYFVCDSCAQRYWRWELIRQNLIGLSYPVYRLVTSMFMGQNRLFTNYLLEGLVMLLTLAGTLAAWNLYRALRAGQTPQTELRDRVAIEARKTTLGKGFGYYTRAGMRNL
ncbi:MAG: hypothetical protein ACNA70_03645 [Brevefilum sp.]